MIAGKEAVRIVAITTILSLSACALWFVPESRSRGHVFDDAARGMDQVNGEGARWRLDRLIHQRFPPGTPIGEVIGHIENAGGVCSTPDRAGSKPGYEATICTYAHTNYYATAVMGMGRPFYRMAENEWTVFIVHADGVVQRYVVEGEAAMTHLSREDYLEGLDRQREEEEGE